jgi:pimeloyl-ACP methyl ester carboxylesterase
MEAGASTAVHYRSVDAAGIEIFYREAGNPKSPTILLLHGDRYHLIAPDHPGFGYRRYARLV